jgi:hypothetical protein
VFTLKVRARPSLPGRVPGTSCGSSSPEGGGDPGRWYKDFLLEPDGRFEQILREHTQRGWFMV